MRGLIARHAARAAAIVGLVAGAWTFTASSPASAVRRPWYYPLLTLGPAVYHRFEDCVLPGQSRSTFAHPNTRDNSRVGSSGVFQMEQGPGSVWAKWAPVAGVGTPEWRSTLWDQAKVARVVYLHDGFSPWQGC